MKLRKSPTKAGLILKVGYAAAIAFCKSISVSKLIAISLNSLVNKSMIRLKPLISSGPKVTDARLYISALSKKLTSPIISVRLAAQANRLPNRSVKGLVLEELAASGLGVCFDIIKFSLTNYLKSVCLERVPGAKQAVNEKSPDLFPIRVLYSSHSRHCGGNNTLRIGIRHSSFVDGLFRTLINANPNYSISQYWPPILTRRKPHETA